MSSRNIDFFAVGGIALMLAAFSSAPQIPLFHPPDPMRLSNAVTISSERAQQRIDQKVQCSQQRVDEHLRRVDSSLQRIDSKLSRVFNQ